MKKERNCGMSVYPNMVPSFGGAVMPGSMIPMPGGMGGGMMAYPSMNMPSGSTTTTTTQNNYGSSDLTNQINALEQRVSRLENLVNNGTYSNGYNSSNFQMM